MWSRPLQSVETVSSLSTPESSVTVHEIVRPVPANKGAERLRETDTPGGGTGEERERSQEITQIVMDLLSTVMNSSELCCGSSTVTHGVMDMRVRVQVYVPESEVVRGERVRESLSVEILSSPVTVDPFTVHVALAATSKGGLSI